MTLPAQLISALAGRGPARAQGYLATSSLTGLPNLSPSLFALLHREHYLLLPDLFAQKSKVNLNENLQAAFSFTAPSTAAGWVLAGPCNVIQWGHPKNYRFHELQAGEVLSQFGDWETLQPLAELPEEERPSVLAQRGVIVLKVERVLTPEESR